MRIHFESSGGFVPLHLTYDADTEQLPEELAGELQEAVRSCGVFDFEPLPASSNFPDVISYELRVSDEGRSKSLSVNDVTAGALNPLLTRLRQLALEARQGRG